MGKHHKWFTDQAYGSIRPSYLLKNTLLKTHSRYQSIEIVDTVAYGKALFLGGDMQLTEKDEFIYHEMISHVPLFAHGTAKTVLIIGGGDGGTLREVLKHTVRKVTLVEIDEAVVRYCQKYLPSVSCSSFEDPRVHLIIADGAAYLSNYKNKFDVILIDSTDQLGASRVLFTKSIFRVCRERLNAGGIMVNQIGMPYLYPKFLRLMQHRRSPYFQQVRTYLATVPSYYGGAIGLGWATSSCRKFDERYYEALRNRIEAAGISTKYYSADIHRASFILPPMLKNYTS